MAKFSFKKKIRILLLLALIPMAGVPIWINSGDPPVDSDQLIPPMRAEGKADQHLQKASEDFFFRDFTHAEESYRKAIAQYEQDKNFKKAARTYESLADMFKFANKVGQAEENYIRAADYHGRIKNFVGQGRAYKSVGDLYLKREMLVPAGEWYEKALGSVKDIPLHIVQARVYEALGRLHWKTEDLPRAIDEITHARDTFAALKYQLGYDHMQKLLGLLRRQQKNRRDEAPPTPPRPPSPAKTL